MKKTLFFTLSFLLTMNLYAQKNQENYPKSEFTLEDGSKMNVLFVGYRYPNGTLPGFFYNNDILSFEYKTSAGAKTEKIDSDKVVSVKTFDENDEVDLQLEKLDMKAITASGEVVDKSKKAFQPLIYDGKIKIYATSKYICEGNIKSVCTYGYTLFYIRNHKDNYAIMPVDMDRVNLFNIGSADEKLIGAFRYVGKNCPEYQKYLDFFEEKMKEKTFRKEMGAKWKDARRKAIDEGKSKKLKYGQTQELIEKYMIAYYLDFYGGILNEYEKNCP